VLLRRHLSEIESFIELHILRLQVEGAKKEAEQIQFGDKFKNRGSRYDDLDDSQVI